MKTKFAIGCLVQWYEVDIIGEYIDSLKEAIDVYDGEVKVDFTVVLNQDLEKCTVDVVELGNKITSMICEIPNATWIRNRSLYTIADYRRDFNNHRCTEADVLIWGESDMLVPRQMFVVLNSLHQMSLQNNNPKYLAFFGTCKMWDDTWKSVEHIDFTNKKRDAFSRHGTRYTMPYDEMVDVNKDVSELDVRVISPHKFNGCGLIMSSEVIKSGVNIPESVFFTHEDTAFMNMTNRLLNNIPQYVIKNMLLVHNRNHPKKRMYVADETGSSLGEQRLSNEWYSVASKMCEQNCYNLFNENYKSYTWEDVWDNIK